MNTPPINITLAQINPTVGDIRGNAEKILNIWEEHKGQSDLVVFPELSLCGYQPEDLVLNDAFLRTCEDTINILAPHVVDGPALIIGAPLLQNGKRWG